MLTTTRPVRPSSYSPSTSNGRLRSPSSPLRPSSDRSLNLIRVLLIDDHPAVLAAVGGCLDEQLGIEVIGRVSTSDGAFRAAEQGRPDVAVVDVGLGDAHGLDLLQHLRAQHPDLAVVVFSMYDERIYAERAVRAGALGYVMKTEPTGRVVEAVRAAARGEVFLSRAIASRMLTKLASGGPPSAGPAYAVDALTDREMAVFQMVGQGLTVGQIADRLSLNRKTVETYRRRAKEKLGFDTVAELVQFAIRWMQGAPSAHRGPDGGDGHDGPPPLPRRHRSDDGDPAPRTSP